MVAQEFIDDGYGISKVLKILKLPRSSYYYTSNSTTGRGRTPSSQTRIVDGKLVSNELVVAQITTILGIEFVDYGYLKMTYALRQDHQYRINKKKVYRLMKQAGLLYPRPSGPRTDRLWVKDLVPKPDSYFRHLEFDIKYIWIAGARRNAMVLSVIDVYSRWLLGHLVSYSICKEDMVALFDQIFDLYPMPEHIYVRNDNGSQMESKLVQEYFIRKEVIQEFTKPATPEQNAHIESYHSIMERAICSRYEFEDLPEAICTFERWIIFYNYKRIHSGSNYMSPYNYLLSLGIDMKKEIERKKRSKK